MINLQPGNFAWPNGDSQEAQQIGWDDYKISDIVNYLQETFNLQNIGVYSDQYSQNRLNEDMTIIQQGLNENCTLYLFQEEQQAGGITVKLYLDGQDTGQACQISSDNTCQEIIEQIFMGQQISRMELKNSNFQLLASDPFMQIKNIPQYDSNLHLYAYTQISNQTFQQNQNSNYQVSSQNTRTQLSDSQLADPKQLLEQLVVLSKMSLLIDKNGQYVVFKFHQPFQINGFLLATSGKKRQINEGNYDFVEKNNVQIAQADEQGYSLIVKWGNETFSSIKIVKQG